MKQKKILVVDDEQDLCDILLYNIRSNGFVADACYSAEEALALCLTDYDLFLLDVMMPSMSGFELAEKLRSDEHTAHIPIIFLTAKDTEDDKLHGFNVGADDYVAKPFSIREVMARVKAVLNRTVRANEESPVVLSYEGLVVDLMHKSVSVDDNYVEFTKTEYELLRLLLSHRGRVFSRHELIEKVWPHDVIVSSRTVDVNITRMRKKIGRYSTCIVARPGFGYLFEKWER